jgi:hypothetical protein
MEETFHDLSGIVTSIRINHRGGEVHEVPAFWILLLAPFQNGLHCCGEGMRNIALRFGAAMVSTAWGFESTS